MGYFPNSQARALKTNRTHNLGVLFLDEAGSGLTHEFFAKLLNSFKTEAESLGYDITFISGSMGKNRMSTYEHCKYRKQLPQERFAVDGENYFLFTDANGEPRMCYRILIRYMAFPNDGFKLHKISWL